MASPRQTAANQANALKSTGPRTAEGKARTRGNALKHGLAGEGVVAPEDVEAVRLRLDDWRDAFRPATPEAEWYYEQLVISSVRIERCQASESAVRGYSTSRASIAWDDDRRLAAEETAARLSKSPALTAHRLRSTAQGVDWMIVRWRALGALLDGGGAWTESHLRSALDLKGVAPDLRESWAGFATAPGSPEARALVTREVDELVRRRPSQLDDLDRAAAEAGLDVDLPRPLALLRRYEAAALRRFQWARKRLAELGHAAPARQEPTDAAPAPRPSPPLRPVPPAPDVEPPGRTIALVRVPAPTSPAASAADLLPIRLRDTALASQHRPNRRERRAARCR